MSSSRPAVIPSEADWPVQTVGESTRLLRRGTAPVYVDRSDVLAIGQRCVTDSDFDGTRARPHSDRAMSRVVVPEDDDVLINSTGTGTIGRSVVFRADTTRYIVDGHVTVARPRDGELIGRWLNDTLRSPAGQRYLESRCYAGSTNQVELSATVFASMPISVPEIGEQRRVAEILDTLDDQIRLTKKIVDKYTTQKQGLVDGIVLRAVGWAADGSQGWTSALLGSIVRESGGLIQTGPFGSQLHARDYVKEGVFVVMPQDIINDRIKLDSIAQVRDSMARRLARHRMNPGDVVFARRGDLGRCAEITQREQAWLCGTGCLLVRTPPDVLAAGWLALVYRHEFGQRYVCARAVGSTMANLNGTILAGLRVPLPPLAEQQAAVSAVDEQDTRIDLERRRLAKLRATKLGLFADLLAGRVRVPQKSLS